MFVSRHKLTSRHHCFTRIRARIRDMYNIIVWWRFWSNIHSMHAPMGSNCLNSGISIKVHVGVDRLPFGSVLFIQLPASHPSPHAPSHVTSPIAIRSQGVSFLNLHSTPAWRCQCITSNRKSSLHPHQRIPPHLPSNEQKVKNDTLTHTH